MLLSAMPMVLAGIVLRPVSGVLALSSEGEDASHPLTSASASASLGLPEKVSVSKALPVRLSVWDEKND